MSLELIQKHLIKPVYRNTIIQSLFLMGKSLGQSPAKVVISSIPEFENEDQLKDIIRHQLELETVDHVIFNLHAYPFLISVYKEFLVEWLDALQDTTMDTLSDLQISQN